VNTTSGSTKEQAADVVDAAKHTAHEQMTDVAEKGRGALRRQVDQRSTQMGEQATSIAETLRQTASQMRAQGDPQKARLASAADQGAGRLERVGAYLTESDADEILERAEDMARKQPWLIAGAGLLVGIAAARFMKASSRERYYQGPRNVYARQAAQPIGELPAVELERTIPAQRLGEVR
jgi:ElaB/YqjD/DUF883 family membrane-anchored ribosome-binding protein